VYTKYRKRRATSCIKRETLALHIDRNIFFIFYLVFIIIFIFIYDYTKYRKRQATSFNVETLAPPVDRNIITHLVGSVGSRGGQLGQLPRVPREGGTKEGEKKIL